MCKHLYTNSNKYTKQAVQFTWTSQPTGSQFTCAVALYKLVYCVIYNWLTKMHKDQKLLITWQ